MVFFSLPLKKSVPTALRFLQVQTVSVYKIKVHSNNESPSSKQYFDKLIVFQLDKPESTANNVKRSVSSFFDQVGSALSPPPDDGDEEAIVIQGNNPVFLNRLQVQINT